MSRIISKKKDIEILKRLYFKKNRYIKFIEKVKRGFELENEKKKIIRKVIEIMLKEKYRCVVWIL